MITVHILRHGRTLCLMVHGRPCNWGRDIKWVSFLDPDALALATCTTCKEALALIPREVFATAPASATRTRP